jgi:hypothetical protein
MAEEFYTGEAIPCTFFVNERKSVEIRGLPPFAKNAKDGAPRLDS